MLKLGAAVCMMLMVSGLALASDDFLLVGHSHRVVDGDTIVLDGQKIRLLGIDAPEMDQLCQDEEGNPWHCGARARDMLIGMLAAARSPVSCRITGKDRYRRLLGRCYAGGEHEGLDVQRALVRSGLAVAEYTNHYRVEEGLADAGALGLWAGRFERPKDWRRSKRQKSGDGN